MQGRLRKRESSVVGFCVEGGLCHFQGGDIPEEFERSLNPGTCPQNLALWVLNQFVFYRIGLPLNFL